MRTRLSWKQAYIILLFPILLLIADHSHAGHILSADITYQQTAPGTYQIKVRYYRDCQGLPLPSQVTICYSSVSCGFSNTMTLNQSGSPFILPNNPYLPPATSSCLGGPGFGIERYTYTGNLTLPNTCSDWIVSFSTYPTNALQSGTGMVFLYVSTKIDNLNYPVNSSIQYNFDPGFIYCVNQPAWNDFSATDADGDSISYHLNPLIDNTTVCPPAPFSSPAQSFFQLQSSTPIVMDSLLGVMTFTPTQAQTSFCSAMIKEYRNGILINTSTIEHVIFTTPGCVISGDATIETDEFKIHPNPSRNSVMLTFQNDEIVNRITAMDLNGKTTDLHFGQKTNNQLLLDISQLSFGMYMLEIITNNRKVNLKLVKE
jgi:hypothetical protein